MSILWYCDGKAYSYDCKVVNFGVLYLLFTSVKFWFSFSNEKLTPLRKDFWQKIWTFLGNSLGMVNFNLHCITLNLNVSLQQAWSREDALYWREGSVLFTTSSQKRNTGTNLHTAHSDLVWKPWISIARKMAWGIWACPRLGVVWMDCSGQKW